jgi:hypothetical protein
MLYQKILKADASKEISHVSQDSLFVALIIYYIFLLLSQLNYIFSMNNHSLSLLSENVKMRDISVL